MENIIVGVDDSDSARRALRWAMSHASKDDRVTAVYVWQIYRGARMQVMSVPDLVDLRPEAEQVLRTIVDEVSADLDGPLPTLEIAAYYGHPGQWLVKLSAQADLLVVGHRGQGGFRGLLLGSVTTYVVHHALCPVVVVRPEPGDEAQTEADPVRSENG